MDVTELYKGNPTRTGFFVPRFGGTRDGYTFEMSPALGIQEGQEGVVFVTEVPAEAIPDNLYAIQLLADSAAEYNDLDPSCAHVPAVVDNWYYFDGDEASSVIDERTIPVSQLIAEIEAALVP